MAAIGIVGGTFDPIHYGHLIIGEEARTEYGLDRVFFVTAGIPPHKKDYEVSEVQHRHAMALLAMESNPHFECSDMEIRRPGVSYSVDTVTQFQEVMGQGTDLYFITGADAILEILTWHEPYKLPALCNLVAATRPGYDLENLRKLLLDAFVDQVRFLETPGVHISSTDLRRRVKVGKSIKYMVPQQVEDYINTHGLYR